jgi:hypothetical protein
MPGTQNVYREILQAESRAKPRGHVGCSQQGHGVGQIKPFGAHISLPCALDAIELQDFIFSLLGFGLAFVSSLLLFFHFSLLK